MMSLRETSAFVMFKKHKTRGSALSLNAPHRFWALTGVYPKRHTRVCFPVVGKGRRRTTSVDGEGQFAENNREDRPELGPCGPPTNGGEDVAVQTTVQTHPREL